MGCVFQAGYAKTQISIIQEFSRPILSSHEKSHRCESDTVISRCSEMLSLCISVSGCQRVRERESRDGTLSIACSLEVESSLTSIGRSVVELSMRDIWKDPNPVRRSKTVGLERNPITPPPIRQGDLANLGNLEIWVPCVKSSKPEVRQRRGGAGEVAGKWRNRD